MNSLRPSLRFLVLGSMLAVALPAMASDLFSVNFNGSTAFYKIDQTTAALTVINPAAATDIGDLTSDQQSKVWGVILPPSPPGNALATFDPVTGNVVNTVSLVAGVGGGSVPITSIAWDPVTKVLYGNTTPAFGGPAADQLYSIDPTTGVSTLKGSIILPTGGGVTDIFALGFTQTGHLYGVSASNNNLLEIDPGTGAALSSIALNTSQAFDIASRPEDNQMFLTSSTTDSLYKLDVVTGALTLVGPYSAVVPPGSNLVGLAFVVPEPGTWAMMAAGLALLGFMGARRARR